MRKGIAYTFQTTSIFPRLSVFDNVALAVQSHGARDLARQDLDALPCRAGWLGRPGGANAPSCGHQRLLELAMGSAWPSRPDPDELTQGLAASEIDSFIRLIESLVPQTTVL